MNETFHPLIPGVSASFYVDDELTDMEIFGYNAQNQLTNTRSHGMINEYSYRIDGLRHSKTENTINGATTTVHLWNGSNMVGEVDGNGNITDRYIRGIGLIASKDSSGVYTYYNHNAHGDVVQLVNSGGAVVKSYDYDAFGNETGTTQNGGVGSADTIDTNPFRYCAEYWDSETGTYYLRNRMYNPQTGRFTQEDPARADLNWYTYCGGNPVAWMDPLGLAMVDIEEYARAMGATTSHYTDDDGRDRIRVLYNNVPYGYYSKNGKIDDAVLNKAFGWDSILTDRERAAEVELSISGRMIAKVFPATFSTMDAAAAMFGLLYQEEAQSKTTFSFYASQILSRQHNSLVIGLVDGREAGAYIHRDKNSGKYVLGNVFWGTHEFVGLGVFTHSVAGIATRSITGMVHTHPNSAYVAPNDFSSVDRWLGNDFYINGSGISVYAVTPGAGIIRHNPGATTFIPVCP